MPKSLICGVTGQTGAYLAHLLLCQGHDVVGSSRDPESADKSRLEALSIRSEINLITIQPANYRSVLNAIIAHKPDQIYYLAGQTSVGLSYDQPFESFESISISTLNFLDAIKLINPSIRFFNAGSSEGFGLSEQSPITEVSPMRPVSPYGVAKAAASAITAVYRDSYGLFATTGFLSNHESPLRPNKFVTSKIIQGLRDIKSRRSDKIYLGNIDIARDWGWAPDYVDAIYKIVNADSPGDFIVATGETHSLSDFIITACKFIEIDYHPNLLETVPSLVRPSDLPEIHLSPARIYNQLGWKSSTHFSQLVSKLCNSELF